MTPTDRWADWIRTRRTGGDTAYEAGMLEQLAVVRDRVLDNADLERGETLVDVGCGNGLIAFGALDRGAARVVLTDISSPLLEESRTLAGELGALERCEFLQAPADDLSGLADGSVHVVTTRSVLIFVEDKAHAFAEFFRVLRPGGRISLFEPINTFGMEQRRRELFVLDDPALGAIAAKLEAVFVEAQPESDPMFDFDERDLIGHAETAGFFPIRLDLRLDVEPQEARSWDGFLHSSGNPKAPTFAEAMKQALSAEEAERFAAHLRPHVEQGLGRWRMGSAYLWATKPG